MLLMKKTKVYAFCLQILQNSKLVIGKCATL